MCITFMYVNNDVATSDQYQIVIAFNRDEFFNRPTQPAHFWNEHCISGVDGQPGREGGTWFGMSSKTRRIGALLNILQTDVLSDKKPRGHLVVNYLLTNLDTETYMHGICRDKQLYNPFNLILLDNSNGSWSIHYCCTDDENTPRKLDAGVMAFSNTVVDRQWQKVHKGKDKFEAIMKLYNSRSQEDALKNELMMLMTDRTRHLPDPVFDDNMRHRPTREYETGRSAIFVDLTPVVAYGTRTTTLLLIDAGGRCNFTETTLKQPEGPDGRLVCATSSWETSNYTFTLN